MNKISNHQLSPEMVSLWFLETLSVFIALCGIFSYSTEVFSVVYVEIVNGSAILALTVGVAAFASGLYQPNICLSPRDIPARVSTAALLTVLVIWLVGAFAGVDITGIFGRSVLWPIEILFAWCGLVFVTRLALNWAIRKKVFVRHVAIIGSPEQAARTIAAMKSQQHGFFSVAATLVFDSTAGLSPESLRQQKVKDVILSPDADAFGSREDLTRCQAAGVRIWRDADFWEGRLCRIEIVPETFRDQPFFAHGKLSRSLAASLSRMFDLALSMGLLLTTLPLMGITALLIKMESQGPVFYRQERVGLNGHVFTLYKFRSMRVDAEKCGPSWANKRDPRVTRVGSIIRRLRIDELPQLLNVLFGEMSFIGPRPERPYFVDQIAQVVPCYAKRLLVKPGLTGWAQVNFPYGASIEDARVKLSYDLYYVKHRSLFLDLLILFSTVRVVLFQEGAR